MEKIVEDRQKKVISKNKKMFNFSDDFKQKLKKFFTGGAFRGL